MLRFILTIKKKIFGLKRRYKILLLVFIFIAGFLFFSNSKKTAPLQFTSAKIENIQEEIAGAGNLTGKNSVNMHFRTGGKLAYINVDVGDEVSQGQVIAGLDTTELNIDLREAQNTLRDKRAIVDKIHDDLKDVGSTETFSQRQTRTTAEVAQDNAYEGYLAAQKALSDSVLYSPIRGVITQSLDVVGQSITASDVIVQIVDNEEIYFDTDIDEADIGKIKIGLPATINLDAYSDTVYKGQVAKILPQTNTTSSGATVIKVRIKADSAPANFVNDLSGEAAIVVKSAKNALVIPLEALREDNTVFVEGQKGLRGVKVTPGISSDTSVEIIEGLREKDRVLLNPPAEGIFINRNSFPLSGLFRIFGGGGRGLTRSR